MYMANEHSVFGEEDFKPELVALSNGMLWSYCCNILQADPSHADVIAKILGSPTFLADWFDGSDEEAELSTGQRGAASLNLVCKESMVCKLVETSKEARNSAKSCLKQALRKPHRRVSFAGSGDCLISGGIDMMQSVSVSQVLSQIAQDQVRASTTEYSGTWESRAGDGDRSSHFEAARIVRSGARFCSSKPSGVNTIVHRGKPEVHAVHDKLRRSVSLETGVPVKDAEEAEHNVERVFRTAASIERLVDVVGRFSLENWRVDLTGVEHLHEESVKLLKKLPSWDRQQSADHLRLYVDGSHFCEQQTAWAVIAVGQIAGQWVWMGYISGRVHPLGAEASLGDGECNAHTAELHAMIFALCSACSLDCACLEIVYDSTSAADIVQGIASSRRHQKLARMATNLATVAGGRQVQLGYRHV